MVPLPSFHLRNVHQVLQSSHDHAFEPTKTVLGGHGGAVSSQPSASSDARIARWAAASGQVGSQSDFAARLDGAQVGAELMDIFRETPEFGRSLAARIDPFLNEASEGQLRLVGGGGEAIVFGDAALQFAVKLLAPPGKAGCSNLTRRNAGPFVAVAWQSRWSVSLGLKNSSIRGLSLTKLALLATSLC